MQKLSALVLGVISISGVASCGSGGASSCGTAPCGGDIVGDWTITESCLTFPMESPIADCPSATVNTSGFDVTGNISYRSDLSYSGTLTIGGSFALTLPPSCLTVQGITLTCGQVDQAVKQAMIDMPDPTIQSVSCTGSGSCVCTFQLTPMPGTTAGTYTTSGTQLIEDGTSTSNYCAKGSELHVMSTGAAAMAGGSSGEIVLKK